MARKFILAVSGASGSIYARLTLEALKQDKSIDHIAVILSSTAQEVMNYEGEELDYCDSRIKIYKNTDYFSPCASGSSDFEAMIIVPCSTGTMGRIASGVCSDLISRTADVMLKEKRTLIIAPRESPLSLIHLRNMNLLAECGAVIMPPMPAFYTKPLSIEELCANMAQRIAHSAGAKVDHFSWGE